MKRPNQSLLLHSWTFGVAVIALLVAFSRNSADSVRREVYAQVVRDVANELAPVYRDLRLPAIEDPKTIGEAIRPLLGLGGGSLKRTSAQEAVPSMAHESGTRPDPG